MCYFKLEDISYKYPLTEENILKNITIGIEKGEFWAVIGKNGSGKTTLCNVLRRFAPDFYKGELTGRIILENKELKDYTVKEIVQKIGFVFQNPFTQISGVKETVFEEIAFGLENLGLEANYIKNKVEETLELLHIKELRHKNPYELSGGQGQKVALASIIAMEPEILIIDEPTSQLDPQGTEEIFKIINMLAEKGKTIILVEHKIELIGEYAEKIIVLDEGEIILKGDTKDVLKNKLLLEKEIGMPQYAMLAYELSENMPDKIKFEEIPITKEAALRELKKYR
jgi:cobalt import ATP-binding protein cbiO 1